MTTAIRTEVASRRRRIVPKGQRVTAASDLREAILDMLSESSTVRWPSDKYRADPVAFFEEVLGVEPWSKQVEVIEMVRDHPRVAVASGHKVSKSHTAAGIALWYYCSFPDARVVMSSTTSRQVDQILWRELQMMRARSGACVGCKKIDPDGRKIPRPCPHSAIIDGDIGQLARTGLKSDDFREIVGFTAREAEAVAGISGRNLLYIIDEASGVPDVIFEAIEGNRAGGARIVLFSNPTRTMGEFFEAFHGKSKLYKSVQISSESTPNVVTGRLVVPGLATREWIDEKREEWGEDSPIYRVRVRGEFALNEDGKIFSIHAISEAERRWKEAACETCDGTGRVRERECDGCNGSGMRAASGRLYIGIDPAGATGTGDESAFCVRRGLHVIELVTARGLDEEGHLSHIIGLISKHKLPRETPVVVFDREGNIGSNLFGHLRGYRDANRDAIELVAVRASDRSQRQPLVYDRQRDALAANLEAWFKDGGQIPEDTRLAAELHCLEWVHHHNGRLKVTPKKEIKKMIGRSPDRYDSLALSCWEPLSLRKEPSSPVESQELEEIPVIDPYEGRRAWRRRR